MDLEIDGIDDIYREKLNACDSFMAVTRLLETALEAVDLEAMDNYIGKRNELINIIDQLDRKLAQHPGLVPKAPPWRRAVPSGKGLEDLGEKLMRMSAADNLCLAAARKQCVKLCIDLQDANQKLRGLHSYMTRSAGPPRFISART